MKTLLVVAAALVDAQHRVLMAERPAHKTLAGYFEFPGGKVEAGEAPEAALSRELHEELGIEVARGAMQPLYFLSHPYAEFNFHLLMPVWLIRQWRGEPQALEHASLVWTRPNKISQLNMLEADQPLIDVLIQTLA